MASADVARSPSSSTRDDFHRGSPDQASHPSGARGATPQWPLLQLRQEVHPGPQSLLPAAVPPEEHCPPQRLSVFIAGPCQEARRVVALLRRLPGPERAHCQGRVPHTDGQ
jgi:hypothetical protein